MKIRRLKVENLHSGSAGRTDQFTANLPRPQFQSIPLPGNPSLPADFDPPRIREKTRSVVSAFGHHSQSPLQLPIAGVEVPLDQGPMAAFTDLPEPTSELGEGKRRRKREKGRRKKENPSRPRPDLQWSGAGGEGVFVFDFVLSSPPIFRHIFRHTPSSSDSTSSAKTRTTGH